MIKVLSYGEITGHAGFIKWFIILGHTRSALARSGDPREGVPGEQAGQHSPPGSAGGGEVNCCNTSSPTARSGFHSDTRDPKYGFSLSA